MLKKFFCQRRVQLWIIAFSLAVTMIVFGLSAYLTGVSEEFHAPFYMRHGTDFGVDISSTNFQKNATIVPGDTAAFDPYLTNSGNYDSYVFMKVTMPNSYFHLSDLDTDHWFLLSQEGNSAVYAYGSSNKLSVLPAMELNESQELIPEETPSLCSSITVDSDAYIQQSIYDVSAVGYAIQSDDIPSTQPEEVWNMIGDAK